METNGINVPYLAQEMVYLIIQHTIQHDKELAQFKESVSSIKGN